MAARIDITAMTTSSSIKVNPATPRASVSRKGSTLTLCLNEIVGLSNIAVYCSCRTVRLRQAEPVVIELSRGAHSALLPAAGSARIGVSRQDAKTPRLGSGKPLTILSIPSFIRLAPKFSTKPSLSPVSFK